MSIRDELLHQMRDLHQQLNRVANDRMRTHGASLAQLKLLLLLERSEAVRSTDLANALGHSPRTITEAIDVLERDGLVVRAPDPNDRRVKLIVLTEEGRAVIRGVAPYRDSFAAELFGVLSDDDQTRFLDILKALSARLLEMEAGTLIMQQPHNRKSGQHKSRRTRHP